MAAKKTKAQRIVGWLKYTNLPAVKIANYLDVSKDKVQKIEELVRVDKK